MEFVAGGSGVQVLGSQPSDAPDFYREAAESIRRGAEQVLNPMGLGAVIRIRRIVLHDVDFKPRKFERFTAEELRRVVEHWQAEPGTSPDNGCR